MKKSTVILSSIFILGVAAGTATYLGSTPKEDKNEISNVTKEESDKETTEPDNDPAEEIATVDTPAAEHWIFENVKDSITDGTVTQAMINVKLHDVFVVKTNNKKAIIDTLNSYKDSQTITMFADGYGGEDNITAAKNIILKDKGDYVYFIAAQNAKAIEKEILKTIEA